MNTLLNRIKVAIIVPEDIFTMDGTTVRVHRVIDLLKDICKITVIALSDKQKDTISGFDNVRIKGLGIC